MTILDEIRQRAERSPDEIALVSGGREGETVCTYAGLVQRFERLAAEFRQGGLRPGQRCGLLVAQGPEFIHAALGILAAGGCVVPISEDYTYRTVDRFAERAHLHALVVDKPELALHPSVHGGAVDGADDRAFRALDPAYLRYTSGTTGASKGVILSHGRILERLEAANAGLCIGPSDRVLWLLPMAHHFVVSILLYLRYGAAILIPRTNIVAGLALEIARRHRASVVYASPHHLHLLAKDGSDQRLDSVRLAVSTTEGLPRAVAELFEERFGCPLVQALGIIEVGLPVLGVPGRSKPGALGVPLPAYEVWLRGEDGKPAEHGEICIRGPGMFDAYLDPWTPSRAVLEPDGFRTGDQGYFDASGELHLEGRRVNRISYRGRKFFCEEVEAVVDRHPSVRESRVFAQPHAQLGEIPAAEIVLEPGAELSSDDLARFCRAELPPYKVPVSFTVVPSLDRTRSGKLARTR